MLTKDLLLLVKTIVTESKALIDNYPSTRSFEQLFEPAKLTMLRLVILVSCDSEGEGGESA